jgi:hypothetical protein
MDTNLAEEALENANQMLSREGLRWIGESSLHLRAFYWGVYCGLGKAATEADLNRIGLEVVAKTMHARPGDDPFRGTKLGVHFDGLRDELRRHVDTEHRIRAVRARNARRGMSEGQSTEPEIEEPPVLPIVDASTLLRPFLDCIARLADRRRNELSRVQEALETVVASSASPEEILRVLERLDSSIRFLAGSVDSE